MKVTVKNFIKKSISVETLKTIRNMKNRRELKNLYKFDLKRHQDHANYLNNTWSLNNLRSKITFHYHSIEKGLTNPDVRLGFGKKAFTELFFAMDKFLELNYSIDDNRFQQGISVIQEYVDFHKEKNYPTEWVSSKLDEYSAIYNSSFKGVGGYGLKKREDMPNYGTLNFKELAQNRYSIRDFGESPVDDTKVNDAIQIATKTPSVCNRQAYRVYRIKNKKKLEAAYRMQGGLTTQGENLQEMLLVTCSREFMNGSHERNQTYIDGGMFLMSLVYALTYQKIASCTLNADFTIENEKAMRELLKVSYAEDLIAFVAIGTFKDENKYAKSPRDNWKDITIVID